MTSPNEVSPADRERAHRVLDRVLDLLATHALSGGVLRFDVDRQGRLHLKARDLVADVEVLLTSPDSKRRL